MAGNYVWKDPTQSLIQEMCYYDPETGRLRWQERRGHEYFNEHHAGELASYYQPHFKCRTVGVILWYYSEGKLVWLHQNGNFPRRLQYKDKDKLNTRIENLLEV